MSADLEHIAIERLKAAGGQKMKNPCDNCKTRWLCKPYGGACWKRMLYLSIKWRVEDA